MAPLATDPQQLLVVLHPSRRRVLYTLARDITVYMREQLVLGQNGNLRLDEWDDGTTSTTDTDNGPTAPGAETRKSEPPDHSLASLRRAALEHFDLWSREFLDRLQELTSQSDDHKAQIERRNRSERLASDKARRGTNPARDNKLRDEIASTKTLYSAISNSLNAASVDDRKEILSCLLLLHLVKGNYSAHAAVFMRYLASSLDLPLSVLATEEKEVAQSLIKASSEDQAMSADAEAAKRRKKNEAARIWKVGLASVAGAAVIGVTGGLAAPVVAGALGGFLGTVGLGSVASFLGVFWMNGALVGALFGAFGAQMTGRMMDKYAKEVEDFKFLPLHNDFLGGNSTRRLRVTVGINGWLTSSDDVKKPWQCLGDDTEAFALRYEMKSLLALGSALNGLVKSYAWNAIKMEILKRTVLASLWAALWPAYILSFATKIDNPFSLASNKSEKAGRVLADAIINKVQGERPVTLVGYSLGARAIYTCLKSLADRRAFGLIDTVILIGAPAPSDKAHWLAIKSVVAGNIHNVFSSNDCILAFMYRTSSLQLGVAGLQDIQDVRGVINMDLSDTVSGHLRYPGIVNQILARCGFVGVSGGDEPIEKDEIPAGAPVSGQEEMVSGVYPEDEGPKPPLPPRSPNASPPVMKYMDSPVDEEGPRPQVPPRKPIPTTKVEAHPDPDIELPDPERLPPLPVRPAKRNSDIPRKPVPSRHPSVQTQHPSMQSEQGSPQSSSSSPRSSRSGHSNLLAEIFGGPPPAYSPVDPYAGHSHDFATRRISRRQTFQTGRGMASPPLPPRREQSPPMQRRPVIDNITPSAGTAAPVPGLHRSATEPVVGSSGDASSSPVHPFLRNPSSQKLSPVEGPLSPFVHMLSPTSPYPEESDDEEVEGGHITLVDNEGTDKK